MPTCRPKYNELEHIQKTLRALQSVLAQKIFILLSSGQEKSIAEIGRLIDQPAPTIRKKIIVLIKNKIIKAVPKPYSKHGLLYIANEQYKSHIAAIYDNARIINRHQKTFHGWSKIYNKNIDENIGL